MKVDAFKVVRDFEAALCEYTGARYAVTTNSCTMAILLACAWCAAEERRIAIKNGDAIMPILPEVSIPKLTYVGVPMAVRHAGFRTNFRNIPWRGIYRLDPLPVYDAARWFTSGMFGDWTGKAVCVSFHWSKTLGIQQGGAILHDSPDADEWLRRARFDGRAEGVPPAQDTGIIMGWHCYMSPEVAAEGLVRLSHLPMHNDPLPNSDYPDLSKLEVFK